MTNSQAMIWFIATAVMTATVLAVGTLAAADILTKRGRDWHKAVQRSRAADSSFQAPKDSDHLREPRTRHTVTTQRSRVRRSSGVGDPDRRNEHRRNDRPTPGQVLRPM
jgi:hypothetical protein